jgi:Domain of unknown function (DUF4157)
MPHLQRAHKPRDKSQTAKSEGRESSAPAAPVAATAWLAAPAPAPFSLGGVQRKVAIGESNDAYERQADQVANRVVSGGRVPPGSISPIAPASVGASAQREAKPEEKKKDDKPAAPAVQREVKPEDKKKDIKSAGAELQRQAKPDEKRKDDKPPTPSPVQKQAKPEEKQKEDQPAKPAPVQKQAKPEEKKKDDKSTAPTTVQKQSKPEEKKKDNQPAPVQKQAKPDDKQKDDKPSPAPVQKQTKPEDKKNDDKPTTLQRSVRPEDKKKEEVPGTLPVQRAGADHAAEKEEPVQASRSGQAAAAGPSMQKAAAQAIGNKGTGEPLNSSTRGTLESALGTDLSDVRVHHDSRAHEAADALNARAFTHQNDIWLGGGESQSDTRLMAHEATHVVQQTGSVHRQLVQRAGAPPPDPSKATTPPPGATPTGNTKTGLLDPTAKTITFDELPIPAFKANKSNYSAHLPLIRKKDYKRGNPNQRDKWRDKLDKAGIEKQLTDKTQPVKKGMPSESPQYVFKVPTHSGGKPFMIGTIPEIAVQLTTPYWGGTSKTPDAKTFDVDHIVELQVADWDTNNSWANETPNMELLESSANQASGRIIADAIDSKVNEYLKTANPGAAKAAEPVDPKAPIVGKEAIKRDYDLVFNRAKGAGGPSVGKTDVWTKDQIEKGDHLGPVEASSLDDIGGKGRVLVFSGAAGGLGRTFLWNDTDTKPKTPSDKTWPKPFNVKSYSFDTSVGSEKSEKLGTVTLFIGADNPKWEPYPDLEMPVLRIPGARHAGHLNRQDVRAVTGKLSKKGASPIQVDQFDLTPEGILATGRILPDVPLIKEAGIEFELRGDDVKIFKTFKTGELTAPKPLSITDSALTISASTAGGLAVDGQVNFAIEKVGAGFLKGMGSTKGGFSLAGSFDFDSQLFDPANVHVEYKDHEFSGGGKIGIKPGKIRGIKSATIDASFGAGVINAHGSITPDIPGIEQADLSMHHDEKSGLTISGDLQLKKDIPGLAGGSIHAEVNKKEDKYVVKASGEATPKIPGISSKLTVTYDDGAFDATVTAGYEKGMLKGSVTVGATNRPVDDSGKPAEAPAAKADKITLYGGGSVTLQLAPWLQATAAIKFKPDGDVQVMGKIALPSVLDIFGEKKVAKNIFKIGILIPIVPGVSLNVGGGLDLDAGIGPGQLQEMEVDVTYDPAKEDETLVHGHAALHIPAHAGLRMNVHAALDVGIPLADIEGGIELGGSLGIEGALHAGVDVDWSPKKGLVLDASAEIYGEPKFRFDITGYVKVEVGVGWLSKTLWEKRWELAAVEYGSGLRLGLKLPVHYEEGKPFNVSLSDIQFQVPDVDPMSVLKGLIDKIT